MHPLEHYLERAEHGDHEAALTAAKVMALEKYHDFMIQTQLKHAASLGNAEAMRWLGLLCLAGRYISDSSGINSILYEGGRDTAIGYFARAAVCGDALSMYMHQYCLSHPDLTKDGGKAFSQLTPDAMFSVHCLLDIITGMQT